MDNVRQIVEQLIAALGKQAAKAAAMPPRDPNEPGHQRKRRADLRLANIIERIFAAQKLRLSDWLRLHQSLPADVILPEGWGAIDDNTLRDLIITMIDARQDGIRLFGEQVQTGIDYSAANARAARRAREYTGQLVKGLDESSTRMIRDVIATFAETPGMTVQDVIDRLPLDADRARRVAVTEITRAYAEGEIEAGVELRKHYPDVQVVKTWFTNRDEKVCPICEPLDGKSVPLDDGWTTDGAADPEGLQSPPAHPNCRCWIQARTQI